MRPNQEKLYNLAADRGGLFTAAEAHRYGFSKQLLAYHAARGRFARLARGVYRLRQFPPSPLDDIAAAWLIAGANRAVVSHESALVVYGLGSVNPRYVHLTLPRSARDRAKLLGSDVKVHTPTRVPIKPGDTIRRSGIPVVRPARAIVESAAAGSAPDMIEQAVREALARGLTSERELLVAAHPFGKRVERIIRAAVQEPQK